MAEIKYTFRENLLRIVAVIGLIAVLLLGAWGIIQLAFALPSFFNGTGGFFGSGSTKSTLTVSLPPQVAAGTVLPVSWKSNNTDGAVAYQVSYSCAPGLTVLAPLPTGALQPVQCNTPFNYTNASSTVALIPTLDQTHKFASTTITVTQTKLSTGAVLATASGRTTVNAPVATTTTAKPTTTKPATTVKKPTTGSGSTYTASGRTTNLYGYADLAVTINSVVSRNGHTTLQFTVSNIGTNVSAGNWSFDALLPIQGTYAYHSNGQQALYPGDKIVYTMGYDEDYNNYNGGYTTTYNQYDPYGYNYNQSGYQNGNSSYYGAGYYTSNGYNTAGAYGSTGYSYGQTYGAPKTVTVQVDPYNQLPELTKNNNIATQYYQAY